MVARVASIQERLKTLAATHLSRDPASYLNEADRLVNCSIELTNIKLDWSLQRLDQEVMDLLWELSEALNLRERLRQQCDGAVVNLTEQRTALHTAMRGTATHDCAFMEEALRSRLELTEFASKVLSGEITSYCDRPFTNVLHVGIGGSHLAQKFLCRALSATRLSIHFLTNSHISRVNETLAKLDPRSTLVIVASKSATTPETTQNYQRAKQWFIERTSEQEAVRSNVVFVTANPTKLDSEPGRVFLIPEQIGGRFSVWSAMGLPVLLAAGTEQFDQFLKGGARMDRHALESPDRTNAAILLALLAHWNTRFLKATSHGVLTYVDGLRYLPDHLQQLEMESLGKSVTVTGNQVEGPTTSVVWGGEETDGQHAWHQWLHQGNHRYSADFIAQSDVNSPNNRWNLANCLAQHHVTFAGHQNAEEPHKSLNGGNGSTLISLNRPDAETIGMLIALYEHKVACLGYLWNVNPFDQWGVERGKIMAEDVDRALTHGVQSSPSTLLNARVRKILASQISSK